MAWFDFFWTDEAIEKLAQHGVTVEEFEHVVCFPEVRETSRSSDRTLAKGYTEAGRWLLCFYEDIDGISVLPITCYEPTERW